MISTGQRFDTILLLGHNFGLLESKQKAKNILRRLYKIMPAECRIIAETMDPHKTNNHTHLLYQKSNVSNNRNAGTDKDKGKI